MENKLAEIFKFLEKNQSFNTTVQRGFYQETLAPFHSVEDKLKSLLWKTQNTQSQPKLSNVAQFWKSIEGKDISSFKKLLSGLNSTSNEVTFLNLFNTLLKQASWGNKTSALFVKKLYDIHANKRYLDFAFLPGTPKNLSTGDKFYLPVDKVIINIFARLIGQKTVSFGKINNQILNRYTDESMQIWDDLWFWGFITQKGSKQREFVWNEEKYWALLYTPKDSKSIQKVKQKANEFISLIKV